MQNERAPEAARTPDRAAPIEVHAHRCPYCHDGAQVEDSVVCKDCLARHHAPCWSEAGSCSACSSARPLTSRRRLDALVAVLAAVSLVAWLSGLMAPARLPRGEVGQWGLAFVATSLIVYFGVLRPLGRLRSGDHARRLRASTDKTTAP